MSAGIDKPITLIDTSLMKPHFHAIFFFSGYFVAVVIHIPLWFFLGLSVADDRVFALEALLAGIAVDQFVFRRFLKIRLVVLERAPFSFLWLWALLCGYVFFSQPFE